MTAAAGTKLCVLGGDSFWKRAFKHNSTLVICSRYVSSRYANTHGVRDYYYRCYYYSRVFLWMYRFIPVVIIIPITRRRS